MPDFIAQSVATDSYTPPQLMAGGGPPYVSTAPEVAVAGQNLAQYAPVGRITASGKIKIWNPAGSDGSQILIGLTTNVCDATAADQWCEVYKSGVFNIDAIAWPGTPTVAQKLAAFDASSPLQARHLSGSATHA